MSGAVYDGSQELGSLMSKVRITDHSPCQELCMTVAMSWAASCPRWELLITHHVRSCVWRQSGAGQPHVQGENYWSLNMSGAVYDGSHELSTFMYKVRITDHSTCQELCMTVVRSWNLYSKSYCKPFTMIYFGLFFWKVAFSLVSIFLKRMDSLWRRCTRWWRGRTRSTRMPFPASGRWRLKLSGRRSFQLTVYLYRQSGVRSHAQNSKTQRNLSGVRWSSVEMITLKNNCGS
jgi:hypothetical protein